MYQNVLDKVDSRLGGWTDRRISNTSKVVKIKSIFSTIPSYPLSYLLVPKYINKKFESKFRNLFWENGEESKSLPLTRWENICKPNILRVLGVKNLS